MVVATASIGRTSLPEAEPIKENETGIAAQGHENEDIIARPDMQLNFGVVVGWGSNLKRNSGPGAPLDYVAEFPRVFNPAIRDCNCPKHEEHK
jgi:hypothetical protein